MTFLRVTSRLPSDLHMRAYTLLYGKHTHLLTHTYTFTHMNLFKKSKNKKIVLKPQNQNYTEFPYLIKKIERGSLQATRAHQEIIWLSVISNEQLEKKKI